MKNKTKICTQFQLSGYMFSLLILCLLLSVSGCQNNNFLRSSSKGSRVRTSPVVTGSKHLMFQADEVKDDMVRFIEERKASNGLIASFTESSSYVFGMDTGKFHECFYGKMGYLEEQSFTYDIALVIIGFLLLEEQEMAEHLLTIFEDEFYLKKNGQQGLFNSYLVTSNIPVEDLALGSDGDRIHAGPTLWMAIAALNHAKLVRNTRYLELVLDIVLWCRNDLTYYRFPDGERGAISMGFGWGPEWSKIFSTEHNVDYFSVLRMLSEMYEESSGDIREIFHEKNISQAWLIDEMEHVGRWLREIAFDEEYYCFIAGVNQFGRDRIKILDGTSWGLGGIGPENFEKWGIDIEKLVASTEKHFQSSYKLPGGEIVQGFDFTDREGTDFSRDPLVWFEGTGQMIIAYAELAGFYSRKGKMKKSAECRYKAFRYINDMHKFSYFHDLKGGLPYMAVLLKEKQIVKTLKYEWEIPRSGGDKWVPSLSSTMWFLYSINDQYNSMKWNKS